MSHLRILAPVVVDHYAVPGAALRDPVGYAAFWAEQQAHIDELLRTLAPVPAASAPVPAEPVRVPAGATPDDGSEARPEPEADAEPEPATEPERVAEPVPAPVVVLEHTRPTSSLNLYRTIDATAVDRPMHVLTGQLRPEHLPEVFDGADALCADVTEISFRLFDHGLLLVEAMLPIDEWLEHRPDGLDRRLDELQARAVALGEALARACTERYLDPVLDALRRADRDGDYLESRTDADDAGDFGDALWVTRTLVVSESTEDAARIVRHWTKDVLPDEDGRAIIDDLCRGDRDHLVRWLNYVFIDRTGAGTAALPHGRFADEWEALRYAQVFYGALDRIDTRLSKILADSAATTSRWEQGRLKDQLVDLSQRAELIIMERQNLSKYLKRSIRWEMDSILEFWDYEALLEEPVRFKIATCDRRLADLAARRTARSTMFTDIILLGIGVTSILATALAVTQFGRSIAGDANQTGYDLGASGLTEWFAAQPADAILVASGVVSLLLVIVYLFFRRDNDS